MHFKKLKLKKQRRPSIPFVNRPVREHCQADSVEKVKMKIRIFDSQDLLTPLDRNSLLSRFQFSSARFAHRLNRIFLDVSKEYSERRELYRVGVYIQFKSGKSFSFSSAENQLAKTVSRTIQQLENKLQAKPFWGRRILSQVKSVFSTFLVSVGCFFGLRNAIDQ